MLRHKQQRQGWRLQEAYSLKANDTEQLHTCDEVIDLPLGQQYVQPHRALSHKVLVPKGG